MEKNKVVNPAAKEIGLRIACRRIELGMNQKQLSIQADIPYQTISLIENGRRMPDTDTLIKFAHALKVPFSALQPKSLDPYCKMPAEALPLIEKLKELTPEKRKTMIDMFMGQMKTLFP